MIFYYFTLIIICITVIILNNLDMNQQNNNKYIAYADIEDLHNSINVENLFNYIKPNLPKIQIKIQEAEGSIEEKNNIQIEEKKLNVEEIKDNEYDNCDINKTELFFYDFYFSFKKNF